ncbi:MAG: SsrA-binding protein [Deltaproteobacteria bacterium]|nr:SsrA-binding protein [Deltaproteobacteria bacterium]
MGAEQEKVVASNRRAYHLYEVLETFEAGMVLAGPEVKSLREARANLGDAYGVIRNGECWLEKLHISPYEPATRDNLEVQRPRKLLLHRHQIHKLQGRVIERGFTLVPLRIYFKEGRAKVELALVRGKRLHDKRESLKRKDADREAARAMRERNR